jgi:hypothetical protein
LRRSAETLHAQIRNPKSEIRRKPEIRNPETQLAGPGMGHCPEQSLAGLDALGNSGSVVEMRPVISGSSWFSLKHWGQGPFCGWGGRRFGARLAFAFREEHFH